MGRCSWYSRPCPSLNSLAPKLLFATGFLVLCLALLTSFRSDPRLRGRPTLVLLALGLLNPYFWAEIACYGHFDILVALCCVVAVELRLSSRDDIGAGLALGLGVLLKYLPIVLLPFLAVALGGSSERPRPRFRPLLIAVALLTVAAGMTAASLTWGPASLRALQFASSRGSAGMSIFRFLRGQYSPLHVFTSHPNLDALALPALAVAGLAVFAYCLLKRVDLPTSCAAGALVTLLFYRVGFPQYQALVFALLALAWRHNALRWSSSRRLQVAAIAYIVWVALAISFDVLAGGTVGDRLPWAWLEDALGIAHLSAGKPAAGDASAYRVGHAPSAT